MIGRQAAAPTKMQIILGKIRSLPHYQQLLDKLRSAQGQPGLGLPRATRLPVLAALLQDLGLPILLITDRSNHALSLFDELGFWVKSPRYHFAEPNPLFYEQAAWGVATRRERLQTLIALSEYHLPFSQKPEVPPILVASVRSLMTRTLPRRDFLKACRKLSLNQTVQPDALAHNWAEIGYQRANTVLEPGQFSKRGGIMDIWAPAENLPVRLDFFGDEIETIRRFDPASQRTVEKLNSILITPAREFIAVGEQETELSEFHIPLLHQQPASLLDYLPQKAVVLIDDLSIVESMAAEVEEQAVKFRQDSIAEETLSADFPLPYIPWSELHDSLHGRASVELGHSTEEISDISLASHFGHDERFGGRLKQFVEYAGSVVERGGQIVVVSRQSSRLQELWLESDHRESESANPQFIEASLSEGFTLGNLHLITSRTSKPKTRSAPSWISSVIWNAPVQWIVCCAVTSATAKRKLRCAPPSRL
jgi:transcription-repair coupling factor (superfamily II helicase)